MTIPVAILAGGLGTRLGALTADTPKSLIEVAGKPFIQWQIERLWDQGFWRVYVCTGYKEGMVRGQINPYQGCPLDNNIRFLHDGDMPIGTGGALCRAADIIGGPFLWMYGDAYLPTDYRKVEQAFLASGQPALLAVYENDGRWDTSNIVMEDGEIRDYDKGHPSMFARHIDYGMGGLTPQAFNGVSPEVPLDLGTVFQRLIRETRLAPYEVKERFYEIGSLDGLTETRMYLEGK